MTENYSTTNLERIRQLSDRGMRRASLGGIVGPGLYYAGQDLQLVNHMAANLVMFFGSTVSIIAIASVFDHLKATVSTYRIRRRFNNNPTNQTMA